MAARLITLTTDFGLADSYVAEMKGVIYSINPDVRLVDLSHELPPHDILAAAMFLERTCPHFPDRTIHLVVVDPGVGTARRAICVQTSHNIYVGPDNGLLTLAIDRETPWKAFSLTNERFHYGKKVGSTFHGRDIFAPAAAHISLGTDLHELGEPVSDLERPNVPAVTKRGPGVIEGRVVHVDLFGNLVTNISPEDVPAGKTIVVETAGIRIRGLSKTYDDRPRGEMLALWGSSNHLEISINRGSAAKRLGTGVGSRVGVRVV